jgi:1-acyl-sn-glycerol-3-phosphate acyltransferase
MYWVLKFLIGNGMRLYYRQIKVTDSEKLNTKGPMIIVANHPNTLIDAWIIALTIKKPVYYLTKGTFFNSPFKRWILKKLYLIPINRPIDLKTQGVDNNHSFEACYEILERGEKLVIFPEGNSALEKNLRTLKTGAARIALEVINRNKLSGELKICAVGFFYTKGHRFRSSVNAKVGEVLVPNSNHSEKYLTNPSGAAKELTDEIRISLENVLVTTSNKEEEDLIETILKIISNKSSKKDINNSINSFRLIKEKLHQIQLDNPVNYLEIEALVESIAFQTKNLRLSLNSIQNNEEIKPFKKPFIRTLLFMIIGFPFFVVGFIFNILPFFATRLSMPKLVSTKEYYAPVAILLGLFLYPFNYVLSLIVLNWWFPLNWYIIAPFIISLPLLGIYAYHYLRYFHFFKTHFRIFVLRWNQKVAMKHLEDSRIILQQIFE